MTTKPSLYPIEPQPVHLGNDWYEWGRKIGAHDLAPKGATWHAPTWEAEQGTAPIDRYCPYGPLDGETHPEIRAVQKEGVWYWEVAVPVDICALYDRLPLSEKTLLKRMRKGLYPMLRNDRGGACDYYIYEGDNPVPVGVVVYCNQRKLVVHGISTPAEADPICLA